MAKAQTRQLLEDMEYLRELGYNVPEPLIDLVQKREWVRLGILEVWKCKKCSTQYEQFVKTSAVGCSCGGTAEKVWESGLGGITA